MKKNVREKVFSFFSQNKPHTFSKGQILIHADQNPTGIFYIQKGIVRQYTVSKDGEEVTLNMFKEGAFFPMSWAISNIHNVYYFEAMTTCIAYKSSKEQVVTFVKEEPDILFDLLTRVYSGIEGLWTHITHLSVGNARTKLLFAIIILSKRFGTKEKDGRELSFKFTEKDLAEYAGLYRETVSRELQFLKKDGLVIHNHSTFTIPNLQKLEDALVI